MNEIWMRDKKSGWYLTTAGWTKSLSLGVAGNIAGYTSLTTARTALSSILIKHDYAWENLEAVSVDENGKVVTS